ncbi:hypothetical protein HOY82DRAFT_493113, partial [Tuber indicum]
FLSIFHFFLSSEWFIILASVLRIWTRLSSFISRLSVLLGSYEKCLAFPGVQSIGLKHHPTIWFQQLTPEDPRGVVNTLHIGIQANDHAEVDAFYAAAIAAGGKCNGPPGPRPQYTKTYYGAFVFDPEGNNLEAMFMDPVKEAEANAEGCPAAKAQGA